MLRKGKGAKVLVAAQAKRNVLMSLSDKDSNVVSKPDRVNYPALKDGAYREFLVNFPDPVNFPEGETVDVIVKVYGKRLPIVKAYGKCLPTRKDYENYGEIECLVSGLRKVKITFLSGTPA